MSTNDQIQTELREGEVKTEAAALAAEHDVHTLMGKLKELYEKVYGAVAADIHDWHWQAKALKNFHNAPETPDADAIGNGTPTLTYASDPHYQATSTESSAAAAPNPVAPDLAPDVAVVVPPPTP